MTLREQMFQELKEDRESEIQRLKQINRDLKAKLHTLLEVENGEFVKYVFS